MAFGLTKLQMAFPVHRCWITDKEIIVRCLSKTFAGKSNWLPFLDQTYLALFGRKVHVLCWLDSVIVSEQLVGCFGHQVLALLKTGICNFIPVEQCPALTLPSGWCNEMWERKFSMCVTMTMKLAICCFCGKCHPCDFQCHSCTLP